MTGNTEDIYTRPAHPYTRALLSAEPQITLDKSKKQPVSYLIFFAGGLIFIFWIAMFGWIYNQKQGDDDIYGTDLEDILNIDN